jgi:arylsulfatase A-like enzyme
MNLLLISIDSLRLDYVSRTNPAIQTPRFDALTRSFCFYNGLFSASTATRPVHTSLFTGLYPFEHGILGQSSTRMREGFPHLFELFKQAGYATWGFSEAHDLFTGLSYASAIQPYSPSRIKQALSAGPGPNKLLFLHLWGAHTPYGAQDGSALGETARLLHSGQVQTVKSRYKAAVERLFEYQITPVLESIDLRQWSVFIVSDHGESWTAEEPYHGYTLRNSVLRIPLYYHIPGTGNSLPARPVASLIDLFPTLLNLFNVAHDYQGFASDLRRDSDPQPYKLAQIHPDPMPSDLAPARDQLIAVSTIGPQWTLFDAREKFTYEETTQRSCLEHPLSEERLPLSVEDAGRWMAAFSHMKTQSKYRHLPQGAEHSETADLLDQRLRDLGYLE